MQKIQLHEILTPNVIGVSPFTPIRKALNIMQSRKISCLLVLEGNNPVGILTERNIVSFVFHQKLNSDDCQIRDLMSSPVVTAHKNMEIYAAYNLLSTREIRHLVVVDHEDRIVGIVTQSNIIEHLGYEYFVELKEVSKIMTTIVYCVSQEVIVRDAVTRGVDPIVWTA